MEFLSTFGDAVSIVIRGFPVVLSLLAMAILPALFCGIVGGVTARSRLAPLRWLVSIYVYLFRSTPFLMFIFLIYYGLPHYGININSTSTAVVALALCHGAYITEIIRGGLISFDTGQAEAAQALGMSRFQRMRDIVLPQTLVAVIPSLLGQAILMVKDTSLVSIIGISELTKLGRDVVIRTNEPFIVFTVVAAAYFVLCFSLELMAGRLERFTRRRLG
ncbi:MAG: amino acid ABC transporter permease [Pseudorhodobacter sp.]